MSLAHVRDTVRTARRTTLPCDVEHTLETLDEHDRTVLLEDLFDRALSPVPLSEAWLDLGIHISDQTIRRHRNRGCVRCREFGRYPA